MIPCKCGYQDHRFCPLHGGALRKIVRAGSDFGMIAAERVAEAFAGDEPDLYPEEVCLGCVLGACDHDEACKGRPKTDTSARRAFLRFMWPQPGPDAEDVRTWALNSERPEYKKQLASWLREVLRITHQHWLSARRFCEDDEQEQRRVELEMFTAYLREVDR